MIKFFIKKYNYNRLTLLINAIFFVLVTALYTNTGYTVTTEETIDYFNNSLRNTNLNANLPINFKANNISFNTKLNLVIATGNIEITQGNQIIKADKAYIEKDKNYILAEGNIYLKDNENKEIFGDKIEIKNTFNNAIIENIKLLFPDNSLLAAQTVTKETEVITTYNSSYTSCPFSKFFTPFWSLHAKKITYNQKTNTITLYNGWLQIKSMPIMWIPYINYSDPNVKRRFGVLTPYFGNNSVLGYYYTQPIFFPINKHSDLNIKLTYYQNKLPFTKYSYDTNTKPLFQANYSSYIKDGELNLKTSYTPNSNNDWALFSYFQKDLNDSFRIKANFNDTTTRNFLTLYKINNYTSKESFLWQNLDLDYFLNTKNYLKIKVDSTRNINPLINRINNPYNLPQITFKHFGDNHKYGKVDLNFQYNNFLTTHYIPQENNSNMQADFNLQKTALVLNHNLTKNSLLGTFSLDSQLQNVNYYKIYLNNYNNTITKKNIFDSYLGGSVAIKAEYPIINSFKSYNSIINPITQLSYSDLIYNKKHNLSYLDSTTLNINVVNLFENNKYSGFDCYSKGKRLNYGLQWELINNEGFSGQMLVGQSLDLNNNNKSNYLIHLGLHPSPYLKINYIASINNTLYKFEQNNLNIFLGNNLLGSYLSYRAINNLDSSIYNITTLEELQTTFYLHLTPKLYVNTSATFNLRNNFEHSGKFLKNLQSLDTILIWQNSCFSCSIKISRSFYGNTEVKANNSYQFIVSFKNLGTTNIANIRANNLNPFQR